ncbi:MAG TPA: M12 family metallo-peptidase [Hymenobacter sp.]|uniref:zinc-dependent metalloprotease n=1 Tax=Hymenobacter sp. TaxID=1898978 RepID=UPI002D7F5828|nr:M12 family metallo-peptidase [Hymenobacter sp.]HET9503634.1 M12 family metallo-peptidase [Hymenobacter sp.]
MKKNLYPFLLLLVLLLANALQPARAQTAGRAVALDLPQLRRQLAPGAALRTGAGEAHYALTLPTLHGDKPFALTETFVLPAADAAARQRLRTFVGHEVGEPAHGVALVLTPQGLRADFHTETEAASLRPLPAGSTYWLQPTPPEAARPCGVGSVPGVVLRPTAFNTQPSPYSFGTQVRVVRLAVIVTADYYSSNGNSDAAVEQAVVAATNVVTGYYLQEVAVRFELVKPTGGTYYFAMAGAVGNQNLGDVLGSVQRQYAVGTYDVGHCFHNSGGGVAYVGVICDAGYKGGGWSGVGTSGVQHILMHELGHQFGADHTFGGNCGSGASGSQLEPGGGATVMSYAAVCGAQTLTGAAGNDNHFHARSLDQMRRKLNGVTCPTATTNTNQVPTVSAGAAYTIPRNTPFVLTATGTDPAGQTLYYTWDQFDYNLANIGALGTIPGNAGIAAVNDPSAPLFRPRPPRTANSRTFPDLSFVLANRNQPPNIAGEALSNVARDMHFTVTARDRQTAGGAYASDNVTITVAPATGPFALTVLNAPALWIAGQQARVTWDVAGTDQAPIGTSQVRLTLSTDGGQTFPTVLAAATANDGSETITVPAGLATTQARLRLEAVGNIYFDINDVNFTIGACALTATQLQPATALSAAPGSSALYLIQPPFSQTQYTNSGTGQLQGSLSASSPRTLLAQPGSTGGCALSATSVYYAATPVVPATAGVYTIGTSTSFANMVLSLYQGSFNPVNACQNLVAFSTSGSLTTPALAAGLTYTLVVSTQTATLPNPASYALTFGGGSVYAPLSTPGYDYLYVVVNTANNTVVQARDEADLRALPVGTYQVYGLLVQGGYDLSSFVGGTLAALQTALANVAPCAQFSTNARSVTITNTPLATLGANSAGFGITAYPNPVPAGAALAVQVQSATAQAVELQLVDVLGRLVLRRTVAVAAGSTRLPLPETQGRHGLYVLRVQPATGAASQQKIVLE